MDYYSNADFLNKNFGTNFIRHEKCKWKYNDRRAVLMLHFDGNTRWEWENYILEDGEKILHNLDRNDFIALLESLSK